MIALESKQASRLLTSGDFTVESPRDECEPPPCTNAQGSGKDRYACDYWCHRFVVGSSQYVKCSTASSLYCRHGHRNSRQMARGTIEVPPGVIQRLAFRLQSSRPSPDPCWRWCPGHRTEYARSLHSRVDWSSQPAQISGTVIIVPWSMSPRSSRRCRTSIPVDGKSMNRMYPGSMERHANRSSFIPDHEAGGRTVRPSYNLHGGDLDESLRPHSYWTRTGNQKQDQTSREMVLRFRP